MGIPFHTSGLAKGILCGKLSLGKSMLLANFGHRNVNFWSFLYRNPKFGEFVLEKAKNWQFLSKKCRLMALLMLHLV